MGVHEDVHEDQATGGSGGGGGGVFNWLLTDEDQRRQSSSAAAPNLMERISLGCRCINGPFVVQQTHSNAHAHTHTQKMMMSQHTRCPLRTERKTIF